MRILFSEKRHPQSRIVWWIVGMGLLLRAYHFFRIPVMWHDEAALVMNVLSKNFQELLGPLMWHEAAPPLFLWLERGVYLLLGDDLLVLRALPFLASCVSLLLMVPIAKRCLPRASVPWALLLFACSEQLLWHAIEAKPYAIDVFTATLLTFIYCTHQSNEKLSRELLLYALLAPFLIFLTYPACFLYGGVLIASLIKVWHARRLRPWFLYGALSLLVLVSFAALALGPAKAQRDTAMESCWIGHFPNWQRPWMIPIWLIGNTFEVVRYCWKPFGQMLLPLAIVGGFSLHRKKLHLLLIVLALPILLTVVASLLQAYPYGPSRVVIFLAPAWTILIALGIPEVLRWMRRRSRWTWVTAWGLVLLTLFPALRRTIDPWRRSDVAGATKWLQAHRQEQDLIVGNNWTHQYYLRHSSARFLLIDQWKELNARDLSHQAFWLMHSEDAPAKARLASLRRDLSKSWEITEVRHFQHLTVARIRSRQRKSSLSTQRRVEQERLKESKSVLTKE